jgi:hypothetical protein
MDSCRRSCMRSCSNGLEICDCSPFACCGGYKTVRDLEMNNMEGMETNAGELVKEFEKAIDCRRLFFDCGRCCYLLHCNCFHCVAHVPMYISTILFACTLITCLVLLSAIADFAFGAYSHASIGQDVTQTYKEVQSWLDGNNRI